MIPELDRFYRENDRDYGFLVVVPGGVEHYIDQYILGPGYDFPILIDTNASIWADYGLDFHYTYTIFIDPQGTIATVQQEAMTASDMVSGAQELVSMPFSDVASDHPYVTEIADLVSRGVISGFPDGTFGPDAPVTRQQFAKMIVKTLGLNVTGAEICPFSDVAGQTGTDPYYPSNYVAVCAIYGITQGKTATTFAPYDNMTRQQLIAMVARAAYLRDPPAAYTPPFTAAQFSLNEHYLDARKAAHAGLLAGLEGVGETYDFLGTATRGEVCVLLYNLLNR